VEPGQLLVVLEARDLVARRSAVARQQQSIASQVEAAAATVVKAQAEVELARMRQARDADLHAKGFVSPAALDTSVAASRAAQALLRGSEASWAARRADQQALAEELVIARTQLGYTRLVAPMPGLVIQRLVEPGTTVAPGTPILRLVDPRTLWIAMRVDEALVERVAVGQLATIRLRSGSVVPGRVERIAMQSDAATRELEVNVAFTQLPRRVAIDQEAQVTIEVAREQGIVLPADAVAHDAAGRASVLQVSAGRARRVPVQLGPASGGVVLVRAGLAEGDAVVADAADARPGMRVQAAERDSARAEAAWNSP
jgi:HlyD family secretion protein